MVGKEFKLDNFGCFFGCAALQKRAFFQCFSDLELQKHAFSLCFASLKQVWALFGAIVGFPAMLNFSCVSKSVRKRFFLEPFWDSFWGVLEVMLAIFSDQNWKLMLGSF